MRHIFSIICLAASTLTMQAQVKETLTSPNGKVKIEINADKELTFSIIDANKLLTGTPNLLLEGPPHKQHCSPCP